MVFSLLRSFKSLMWCVLVLSVLFLVFGLTITEGALGYLDTAEKWTDSENEDLILYFGTLTESILSLFMSMSGGNDWGQYYDAIISLNVQFRLVFLFFIGFMVCAVMNIVTAVFLESAISNGSRDRDLLIREQFDKKSDYFEEVRELFDELHDGDSITAEEFAHFLQDENVAAFLTALDLGVHDPHVFFMLLDEDGSGSLDLDEFVDGCFKLHGKSTVLDLAICQADIRWLKEAVEIILQTVARPKGTALLATSGLSKGPSAMSLGSSKGAWGLRSLASPT
jgi:hypothetical protein